MSKPNRSFPSTLFAVLSLAQAACDFDPPPTPTNFLKIERTGDAVQPSSPEFGVHLTAQSWGGASVWLEVDGGTLRRPGQGLAAACISVPGDGAFVDIFVRPEDVEALLSAALYEGDCPEGGSTRPEGAVLASDTAFVTLEPSNSADPDPGTGDGGDGTTDSTDSTT